MVIGVCGITDDTSPTVLSTDTSEKGATDPKHKSTLRELCAKAMEFLCLSRRHTVTRTLGLKKGGIFDQAPSGLAAPQSLPRFDPASGPSRPGTYLASDIESIEGEYGFKEGVSRLEALSTVRSLCYTYLNSFPGAPNRSSNTAIQAMARGLLNGEETTQWQVEELQLTLLHRMNLMKWATRFKNFLKLDFVGCHRFDLDAWEMALPSRRRGQDTTKFEAYQTCRSKIISARIFPEAPKFPNHGHLVSLSYPKGRDYLAAAFTDNGLGFREADEALARDTKPGRVAQLQCT
ncbi:MAG: hypothetical protein Q9219_004438 [cf. Caloplaca sp. 3 TL-2023]